MICKNRIKKPHKNPDLFGAFVFQGHLEKRCAFGSDIAFAVILLRSDIVFDSDICPSGKLRIYLNFG